MFYAYTRSCGSAVTNGAVSAFARGCKGLQRLALRRIVGTPSPLGAPGILAVCVHCRELKSLDLEEVPGLDDSALVGFHEHRMEKLKRVRRKLSISPSPALVYSSCV